MASDPPDPLARLAIPPEKKRPRRMAAMTPFLVMALISLALFLVFWFAGDGPSSTRPALASPPEPAPSRSPTNTQPVAPTPAASSRQGPLLTASGYIIPRQRIELTARFPGTVVELPVQPGQRVRQGDVVVKLDPAEQKARVEEAEGRLALARARVAHAQALFERQQALHRTESTTPQALDDARRDLDMARAEATIARSQLDLARLHLDWCTIRSPVAGTILDTYVELQERVIPQSFGIPRGPATTLASVADLGDLQVAVDVNEGDVAKIDTDQPCRVSPEAYPDKVYEGRVAEIATEADRQKGTLEVKVQVARPDRFLVPELRAKVEFLSPEAERN